MIRRLVLVALMAVAVAGCGRIADQTQRGPSIECDTARLGMLILMAQSVPNAVDIPCVRALPPGWELLDIEATSTGVTIFFANDTFDTELSARFTPTCAGTAPGAPGNRIVPIDGGACLAFEPEDAMDGLTIDLLVNGIGFVSRAGLAQASGWDL